MSSTVLVNLVCFACILNVQVTEAVPCESDSDCEDANTYCYVFGSQCVPCYNCKMIRRHNGTKCARDKIDCGPCLPGTKDEKTTDGSKTVCTPIYISNENHDGTTESPKTSDNEIMYMLPYIGIVLIVLVVVIIALMIVRKGRKKISECYFTLIGRRLQHIVDLISNMRCSPPPPYSPSAPPLDTRPPPQSTPSDYISDEPGGAYYAIECEKRQNANISNNPYWVKGGRTNKYESAPNETCTVEPKQSFILGENDPGEVGENENAEETDSSPLLDSSGNILHSNDEVTQPSPWVPDANAHGSAENQRLNFSGIISTQVAPLPSANNYLSTDSQVGLPLPQPSSRVPENTTTMEVEDCFVSTDDNVDDDDDNRSSNQNASADSNNGNTVVNIQQTFVVHINNS